MIFRTPLNEYLSKLVLLLLLESVFFKKFHSNYILGLWHYNLKHSSPLADYVSPFSNVYPKPMT